LTAPHTFPWLKEFEDIYVKDTPIPTEVIHFRGPGNGINWHTFFVPGNPGSLFYYLPWLQEVHAMQQEEVDKIYGKGTVRVHLHGLSHANHHFSTHNDDDPAQPFETYGLDFQIEHTASFFRQTISSTCTKHGDSRGVSTQEHVPLVSFIGHSIGAYFVLDLLDRYADISQMTVSANLIMPFITWSSLDLTHRAKLTALINTPESVIAWVASKLLGIVQAVSLPRRTALLTALQGNGMDAECVAVTASRLFGERMIANFISMGRDEIEQVPLNERRMLDIMTRLSAQPKLKILALHTDHDVWAPANDAETISFHAPHVHTVHVPNLRHAFTMIKSSQGLVTTELRAFARKVLLSPLGPFVRLQTNTRSKL
jgi:pimeloyl-ACP methyl ester carboxylesterase